jgi:hypothetical protein
MKLAILGDSRSSRIAVECYGDQGWWRPGGLVIKSKTSLRQNKTIENKLKPEDKGISPI